MNSGERVSVARRVWRASADYLGLVLFLVVLFIGFGLASRRFLSLGVLRTIANQVPHAVVLAVAMTYVLTIAGIDLSVGSVLALSCAVLGVVVQKAHLPLAVGIVACVGAGTLCGVINGALTIAWRLPSFIVTLGMLEMARGGAYLVTSMRSVNIPKVEVLAWEPFLGLSLPFFVALVVVVVGQFVLSRTVFGRYVVAIGTNEEAVRLSGIDPRPVKLAVFALSGFLAGLAAVLHAARLPSANPNIGQGYELEAIAATVIGGTSLMGGRGSVVASFLGVLIMAVLLFGLAAVGVPEEYKRMVTGLVIIAAVVADYYRRRLATLRRR